MHAGDGMIVRVKPRVSRLSGAEVALLCALAQRFGNGMIDFTNRANLQIRGVKEEGWAPLLAELCAAGLVDNDPQIEQCRNVLVAPDWEAAGDSARMATELTARLREFPELPGKFGFAIDAGTAPILTSSPADIRIERSTDGMLVLRLDGRASGCGVTVEGAVDAMLALARWFVATGGTGRAASHGEALPAWAEGDKQPGKTRASFAPGPHALGWALGIPFGSVAAPTLADLVRDSGASALRMTPWRTIILEQAAAVETAEFITEAGDPLLRADACPGAPFCPQAAVETRGLARRLAPHIGGRLHVSGCAKGCARSAAADVTLTGSGGLFDLVFKGRASDPAAHTALDPSQLIAHFGAE